MDTSEIIECLKTQDVLSGVEPEILNSLANEGRPLAVETGKVIARQGEPGAEVFFIFSGEVSVEVSERRVAIRRRGELLGEMSTIDPANARSATLKVVKKGVVFKVSKECFRRCIDRSAVFMRNLIKELCSRLRDCADFIIRPNLIPRIFICSSDENRDVAKRLKESFAELDAKTWDEGAFRPSMGTLNELKTAAATCDFAIIVLSFDDIVWTRQRRYVSPRDNLLFEVGFFMGAIGSDRTYIVCESDKKCGKIPSDLEGITLLFYSRDKAERSIIDVEQAVESIRSRIQQLGVKVSMKNG